MKAHKCTKKELQPLKDSPDPNLKLKQATWICKYCGKLYNKEQMEVLE